MPTMEEMREALRKMVDRFGYQRVINHELKAIIEEAEAALSAPSPALDDTMEEMREGDAFYIIETTEHETPLYWAGSFGDERNRWSDDADKAVGLARRQDAEAVCAGILSGYSVRIHLWAASPSPALGGEDRDKVEKAILWLGVLHHNNKHVKTHWASAVRCHAPVVLRILRAALLQFSAVPLPQGKIPDPETVKPGKCQWPWCDCLPDERDCQPQTALKQEGLVAGGDGKGDGK